MANRITPEYIGEQVAKYALDYVRLEVASHIRDKYDGSWNSGYDAEYMRLWVKVELDRVDGLKSVLRYSVKFEHDYAPAKEVILTWGATLGKGLVRELEAHHPKAERKVRGEDIPYAAATRRQGERLKKERTKQPVKKKRKKKVKPKKVCPICGPESDEYPPWEGTCDH